MTMQDELKKWAKKAVAAYHKIAEDVNLAYYTQSPLSKIVDNPVLMVVGINPGSGGTYSDQRKNKNWKYLYKDPKDENHLLEGNYCQEEGKPSSWDNHKNWNYWSNLKRCLSESNLPTIIEDDSKVIITNASFFNTSKANEISEDILKKTIPYTLELIQITNPKYLIFLSGQRCFERLSCLANSSKFFKFEYKHVCGRIYLGKLNDRLCIGIPHPAYKTNEELNLVAFVISYLLKLKDYEELDVELIKKECSKQIEDYIERVSDKKKLIREKIIKDYIFPYLKEIAEKLNYEFGEDLSSKSRYGGFWFDSKLIKCTIRFEFQKGGNYKNLKCLIGGLPKEYNKQIENPNKIKCLKNMSKAWPVGYSCLDSKYSDWDTNTLCYIKDNIDEFGNYINGFIKDINENL